MRQYMTIWRILLAARTRTAESSSKKIQEYIRVLREYGKSAGEPYIKHLDGEIWELRPMRERVLFAAWLNDGFILLHHFTKKTQKTPQAEIEKAKQELADFNERVKHDGQGKQ
jgi:phage-related protein